MPFFGLFLLEDTKLVRLFGGMPLLNSQKREEWKTVKHCTMPFLPVPPLRYKLVKSRNCKSWSNYYAFFGVFLLKIFKNKNKKKQKTAKLVLRLFWLVLPLRYEIDTEQKLYGLVKLLRLFGGVPLSFVLKEKN